jgi:hypothetical protein
MRTVVRGRAQIKRNTYKLVVKTFDLEIHRYVKLRITQKRYIEL